MNKNYAISIRDIPEETLAIASEGLKKLSQREDEILGRLLHGQTSKQIARDFGISHRTVEVHRQHILLKTGSRSFVDLIRLISAMESSSNGDSEAAGR